MVHDFFTMTRSVSRLAVRDEPINLVYRLVFKHQRKAVPSIEQMGVWFEKSENQRQKEFDTTMLRYQKHFAHEEKSQWEGEDQRDQEFGRVIDNLDRAFQATMEGRHRLFLEAEGRHQEIFRSSESLRDKQFSDAEGMRVILFQQNQSERETDAKWYADIRQMRFESGREEREEACQKLEKDLRAQLERTLRYQEETFVSAEQERDKTVQEIVSHVEIRIQVVAH